MTKHCYLLEVGLEEMPARVIRNISQQFKERIEHFLKDQRLSFDEVRVYATPRRFTALVLGLAERQKDKIEVVKGPAKRIAQDKNGQWTPAALGFARGKGVKEEALYFDEFNGDSYLFAKILEEGLTVKEILPKIKEVILAMNFPVSMSWADYSFRYIRPVHWYVSLLDDEVIPFSAMEINSGRESSGHRVNGAKRFLIDSAKSYEKQCERQFVVVDQDKRKQFIKNQMEAIEKDKTWQITPNDELLEEVTQIVEWPTVFYGTFSDKYLELPEPVLSTTLSDHQRYFTVKDSNGNLLPYFISVRNGTSEYIEQVISGNEKVLVARLEDAIFFVNEDRKSSINEFTKALEGVTFHAEIGNMKEKMRQVKSLAHYLYDLWIMEDLFAGKLSSDFKPKIDRAGDIYKFDLGTQIVNEFSELQGVMGEIYAREADEDIEVSKAIREHYLPLQSHGELPQTALGILFSVADKLQTIISFFKINKIPSGSNDPFALRRQMTGIVDILLTYRLPFDWRKDLIAIIQKLYPMYPKVDQEKLATDTERFMLNRLKFKFQENNYEQDLISAVLSSSSCDILDKKQAIIRLNEKRTEETFKGKIEAWNRVLNLLPKINEIEINKITFSVSLCQTDSELALHEAANFKQVYEIDELYDTLENLEKPIMLFFEDNMVFCDNIAIRNNRLALLNRIADNILRLADTRLLQKKKT